jgi:cytochrome oxidase assembly protein ShyY1
MRRYRFLATPRWVILTVLVAAAMFGMIWAGFWQLRRLHGREASNALVEQRGATPAQPVTQWLQPNESFSQAQTDTEWRNLSATGTYDVADQVLIRNRSYQGDPGFHVITPLKLADGTAVLINRGWVPLPSQVGASPIVPAPPTGTVSVIGRARATQERGIFGPHDPPTGVLTQMARVDIGRLQRQLPYTVLPAYLELTDQKPAVTGDLPALVPLPELDDGPHLSYAIQWFCFTALAAIGWVLVVRRQLRTDAKRAAKVAAEEEAAAVGASRDVDGAKPAVVDGNALDAPSEVVPVAPGPPTSTRTARTPEAERARWR